MHPVSLIDCHGQEKIPEHEVKQIKMKCEVYQEESSEEENGIGMYGIK